VRLEAVRKSAILVREPNECVTKWLIDVFADVYSAIDPDISDDDDDPDTMYAEPHEYIVARVVADELRTSETEERGIDPSIAADADSSGLVAVWSALMLENDEPPSAADTLVYLYRFAVHPDFSECRMAILDAVCRVFGFDALIVTQRNTTWFSEAEFDQLGFEPLESKWNSDLVIRMNFGSRKYWLEHYPEDAPPAKPHHAEWVEKILPRDQEYI
jgi:hypothetical protein